MIKQQAVTPFKSGTNTNGPHEKAQSVPVKIRGSMMKMGGVKDPLVKALAGAPPKLPVELHPYNHSTVVRPRGSLYNPMGEFGSIKGRVTPATGMTPHTARPGQNAVGSNANRTGQKSGYPGFRPTGGGKNV